MERRLWRAGSRRLTESGNKAMDSRYRRLQRVEKRLWTAGIGD